MFSCQHTHKIITMDNPPFRHQTNTLYTPMTTLKYADPNGDLPIDTFYKMVFEHDKVFNASLNFLKLLRWRSRKSFTLEKDKSSWEDLASIRPALCLRVRNISLPRFPLFLKKEKLNIKSWSCKEINKKISEQQTLCLCSPFLNMSLCPIRAFL